MEIECIVIREVVTFGMLKFWNRDEKDGEINQRYNFLTNPKLSKLLMQKLYTFQEICMTIMFSFKSTKI